MEGRGCGQSPEGRGGRGGGEMEAGEGGQSPTSAESARSGFRFLAVLFVSSGHLSDPAVSLVVPCPPFSAWKKWQEVMGCLNGV